MDDEPEFRCRRCGMSCLTDPGDGCCAECLKSIEIMNLERCDTQPAPPSRGVE